PRQAINQLTGRHLDFFYRRVLGFQARGATPDRAHVVLELKKNAVPALVAPSTLFVGGKDATGGDLLYSPVAESIVNTSRVASLRPILADAAWPGRVRFAPIANSADGLGAPLPEEAPKWRPFGHDDLPVAAIGFAIASTILRLKEGRRTITLTLGVEGAGALTSASIGGAFEAFLTGEKAWIGPVSVTAAASPGQLTFQITLDEKQPADREPQPK